MNYAKPKATGRSQWGISEHVRNIVKYYAEYSERFGEEVVEILENLLEDHNLLAWINQNTISGPCSSCSLLLKKHNHG